MVDRVYQTLLVVGVAVVALGAAGIACSDDDEEPADTTSDPDATEDADTTSDPDATEDPDTTSEPDVTEDADTTSEPDTTSDPDATSDPDLPTVDRSVWPDGPFGVTAGDTMENYEFVNPDGSAFHLADVREVESNELLLIVTVAAWCGECIEEVLELTRLHEEHSAQGLAALNSVWQTTEITPATAETAQTWKDQYDLAFDVVADPDHLLSPFHRSPRYPSAAVLVELDTMEILAVSWDAFTVEGGIESIIETWLEGAEPVTRPSPSEGLLVDEDFSSDSLGAWLEPNLRGTSASLEVGDGVVAVTSGDDGSSVWFERGQVETRATLSDEITILMSAMQASVRITAESSDASGRIEVLGMPFNTGINQDVGGGDMFVRLTLHENGEVDYLLWHCADFICWDGDYLGGDTLATDVDTSVFHDLAFGCDSDAGTCYFRLDSEPVVPFDVDTEQFPFADTRWSWGVVRIKAGEDGNDLSGEFDNVKVGTLEEIFGSLE